MFSVQNIVADSPQMTGIVARMMPLDAEPGSNPHHFWPNVARIRSEREFSQDKLAEKADLDRTYVSGIERGVRNPGIKTVIRIRSRVERKRWRSLQGVDA
jgi:DNA-binding XRE family transcriptional regulator